MNSIAEEVLNHLTQHNQIKMTSGGRDNMSIYRSKRKFKGRNYQRTNWRFIWKYSQIYPNIIQ